MAKATNIDAKGRSVTVTLPGSAAGSEPRLETFMSIGQVEKATGFDRKLIYKWMQVHRFPKQVTVKAAPDAKKYKAFWLLSEVIAWQQARIAERDRGETGETGETAPLPSRLAPPARAKAQITARKNIEAKRHDAKSEEAAPG
jgi:predicted DNA-binding transcriptional regulator AlpA